MDNDNIGYREGTFAEGYAKGKEDERNRIALLLKQVDDTWGMLFLSDLFEGSPPVKRNESLRYGED